MSLPVLPNAARLKAFLQEQGAEPNKALGQNFLVDQAALQAIVTAAEVSGEPVLEIGPGLGALTEALCQQAGRVVAVEKDARMAGFLRQRVQAENLTVVTADFLDVDLAALFPEGYCHAVGNLPYYVTTPMVMKLLRAPLPVPGMTLMLQKEAADRFFARPGEKTYTPLTVLSALQYRCDPVLTLSPASYWPQPQVDSAVVRLQRNRQQLPQGFDAFLSAAFSMRRKTLANNLLSAGISRETTQNALMAAGEKPDSRAEALSPDALYGIFCRIRTERSAQEPEKV